MCLDAFLLIAAACCHRSHSHSTFRLSSQILDTNSCWGVRRTINFAWSGTVNLDSGFRSIVFIWWTTFVDQKRFLFNSSTKLVFVSPFRQIPCLHLKYVLSHKAFLERLASSVLSYLLYDKTQALLKGLEKHCWLNSFGLREGLRRNPGSVYQWGIYFSAGVWAQNQSPLCSLLLVFVCVGSLVDDTEERLF